MPRFLIALLASTALITAGSFSTAEAQGGAGGSGLGGAGGANSNFSSGAPGTDDAVNGGGGGGAGDTGGPGGAGDAPGGAGGAAPGAAGAVGASGANAGAGGGGGAHGIVDSALPTTALTGGAGGAGGEVTGAGGGGGGGAGGAGLIYTPFGNAGSLFDTITGGAGGAGGATVSGQGGQGGQGGAGIIFTAPDEAITIQILANVSGGSGGAGGGISGSAGQGGVGMVGGGLSITLGATLSGALSGDGATRANALELTGGTNLLTIGAGGAVNGGIALNGFAALEFAQGSDATLSGGIQGLGSISKSGAGTLTLNAAGSFTGGSSVSAGTLVLGDGGALGSGQVSIGDATLRSSQTATLANDLRTGFGSSATIAAATGTALTLTGALTPSGSSTLTFGAAGATGNIIANFSTVETADLATTALVVAAGTLTAGGFSFNDLIANAASTTVSQGATLDLNGQLSSINNLQGGGTLTNTDLIRIREGSFSGAITGTGGSLEKVGSGTLILTGTNLYTGTTEISGGTLRIGDGGTTGTLGGGAVTNDGALVFNRNDGLTIANVISGSGSVAQAGSGVLTLGAANSYAGGTTITGGTLALGDIGALGGGAVGITNAALVSSVTGSLANAIGVTDGAAAMIGAANGQTLTLTGALSMRPGSALTIGSAMQTGTVVASLVASDFFSPGTLALNVAGGTLRAGNLVLNQLTQGAASVTIAAAATLDFGGFIGTIGNLQGAGTLTGTAATQISSGQFAGVIAGTGGFEKLGSGTLVLTGANTYSGTTTVSEGTLRIGAGGQLSGGGVTNNAALVFARNDIFTVANAISGSGTLTQAGTGTLILTGANTHTGLTTINAGGTVQIGAGGTSGQISGGAVLNNGALVVNRGDAVTLGNAISGTGTLTQAGAGTLTLTGANSYSGTTTINAGSTLQVGAGGTTGSLGTGSVLNAGTLIFNRSDNVTFAGVGGSGTLIQAGAGTLTIAGGSSMGATVISSGTIRFNQASSVTPGAISGAGRLEIASGTLLLGSATHTGGTLVAAGATVQVGGFNTSGTLSGPVINNGTVRFGGGGPATFVTLDNDFSGTGRLILTSTAITLTGNNSYTGGTILAPTASVTVGNGGTTGSLGTGLVEMQAASLSFNRSDTVLVANAITGAGQLVQIGSGTLILTGANSSVAGTTISAGGTLQVGSGGVTGALGSGGIQNAGALIFNRADSVTLAQPISGGGTLTQAGGGTLTIAGSYSQGATTISAGTLRFAGSGSLNTGAITNNGALIFNRTDSVAPGAISGAGRLEIASGTVAFGSIAHTGGTQVAAGATLQFGQTNSGGFLFGPIVNNGTVRVGVTGFPAALWGVGGGISGTGNLVLVAQGIRMFASNSYTGGTIIAPTASVTLETTGGAGALGRGHVEMQGGSLTFELPNTAVFANAIHGLGTVRQGGGTLILTGENTYSGATQIFEGALGGGTLQIGDGGASGSLGTSAVIIAAGARLAINRSDRFTLPNAISGAGELRQIGAGTTTLTGANTYSGVTRIMAGTLEIAAGGQLGSGAVVNDATFAFNRADAITVANAISGTGALRQSGSGSTTLTGANSYSGSTVIAAGTLSVASDANLGAASGGLTFQGGTLLASQSFTSARGVTLEAGGGGFAPDPGMALTLAGAISGPGGLTMSGQGTLILNGANTYAGPTNVNAGTLILGPPGTLGPGGLTVGTGALLDISRMAAPSLSVASLGGGGIVALGSRDLTLTAGAGVFSGSLTDGGAGGSLTIAGGTTTLTGTSSYTGATTINGGMLVVNGTLSGTSGVVVNGGTLGGNGLLPSLTIASGGSVAPGNSIGTINIGGNLTLAAGSTTVIEVQGRQADRINVSGTASLGGTLRLVPLGGPYVFNMPYTLIRARSVSGQFAAVNTQGSFGVGVASEVTSTTEAVELRLMPAPLGGKGSRNQQAVAGGLDAGAARGIDVSAFFPLYNMSAAAQPRGLDLLSGEVHAAGTRAAIESSGQFLGLLLDPWRAEGEAVGRIRVWASGFGGGGRRSGDGAAGSSTVTGGGGGVAVGAEVRLTAGLTAGFALAGAGTQMSLANGLGRAESNQVHAALYARAQQGAWRFGAALATGGADATTRRQVGYLGAGNLTGRYTAHGVALRLEGGWAWEAPMGVTLTPGIAFQGGWFDTPAFTESATGALAPAALNVSSRQTQSRIEIGLRADAAVTAGLSAFGRVAWAGYLQRDAAISARFASLPGSNFRVVGARPDAQAALLSAGLDWQLSGAWSLTARLDGEVSANTALLGGTARLRYAF